MSNSGHNSNNSNGSGGEGGGGSNSSGGGGRGRKKGITLQQLSTANKHLFDPKTLIVEVWAHNLMEELEKIMDLVDDYPHIAMDTEFPGIVARPIGCFKTSHEYRYQTLKCNVDLLKIIQLGLTLCDEEGYLPPGACTWQFNFRFNLGEDMYAQESIDLLAKSGIDFKEHTTKGIEVHDFAELLMTSGLVLNDEVKWMSFHAGYDYGYLLKLLTCQALPRDQQSFFELLHTYFPTIYDIKVMVGGLDNLRGGLQRVADELKVERIGAQHTAGSDSLLTAATFFTIKQVLWKNDENRGEEFRGMLYGLQHYGPTGSGSSSGSGSGSGGGSGIGIE